MAFGNTPTDVIAFGPGLVMEYGTFSLASVTTGTITATTSSTLATTSSGSYLKDIIAWGFAADGDTAVLPAKDVAANQVKITGTSNETGDYWIVGHAV